MDWVNWIEWDVCGKRRIKIGTEFDFFNVLKNSFGKQVFAMYHLKKIILCA